MSFLDRILSAGGDIDQAVITEIAENIITLQTGQAAQQTAIEALEAGNPTQAAAIAALQTAVVSNTNAITSIGTVNTTQDAAIAANAAADTARDAAIAAEVALNTAQAAAIAAEEAARTATDATQSTAIATLQTDRDAHAAMLAAHETAITANTIYLDVRRYVPGGGPLTQANLQDALDAAYADALVKSNTIVLPFPGAQINTRPRYMVRVPEGAWWLTRSVVIPSTIATTVQPITPGITGVDERSTVFFVDSNTFTATNHAIFAVGGDVTDQYTYGLTLEKFAVYAHGGASNNLNVIDVTLSLYARLQDLVIFGFYDSGTRPDRGWGIRLLSGGTAANNQYPKLKNVSVQGCSGGVYCNDALYLGMKDVQCRQNMQWDYAFSSCVVSVDGGSIESAAAPVASPYRCSKGIPKIVTGWDRVMATGTGASISTASGDVTTVNGLLGLDDNDLHRWLYLEKSSGAYDGTDKVSGYYLITKVVSATSVQIRKGSSHAATGSLIWKTCIAGQVDMEIHGMMYHEGELFAGIGLYATANGAGSLRLGGCNLANTDYAVEVLGCASRNAMSVRIDGAAQMTAYVKARFCPSLICLDAMPANIGDVDEYSREGLLMRQSSYTYSGETSYARAALPSALHSSFLPAGDARTMCRLGGANAMWDARVASFVKSGPDVTSWTDLIGGYVAGLVNSGKYPQYSASDAVFGGKPSVTFTGGSAANTCGLIATIPQAAWVPGQPTIVAVMATPGSSALTPGTFLRLRLVSGASAADMTIGMLENYGDGAKYFGTLYPPGEVQALAQTPDTNAHVFIHGGAGRARPRLSSEAGTRRMSNFVPANHEGWAPADSTLRMNDASLGTCGTFSAAFIAVFPYGLSYAAREQLLSQLCTEFGIAKLT